MTRRAVRQPSKPLDVLAPAPTTRSVSDNFKFGLERVRELREHAEAQAKEALAASLGQRLRGAALLARTTEELTTAGASRPGLGGERTSASDLLGHERWLHALARDHETAALQLDRLDAEVDARRSALGDRSREREVLERLKERKRSEHQAAVRRQEGAQLDEIALAAHERRSRTR